MMRTALAALVFSWAIACSLCACGCDFRHIASRHDRHIRSDVCRRGYRTRDCRRALRHRSVRYRKMFHDVLSGERMEQDFGQPTLFFGAIHDGAGFSLSRTFAVDDPTPFAGTTLTVYLTNFLINSASDFGAPDFGTVFVNLGVNAPVPSIDFATLMPAFLFPLTEVEASFGSIPNATFSNMLWSLSDPAAQGLAQLLILPNETVPQSFVGVARLEIIPEPGSLVLLGLGLLGLAAARRATGASRRSVRPADARAPGDPRYKALLRKLKLPE